MSSEHPPSGFLGFIREQAPSCSDSDLLDAFTFAWLARRRAEAVNVDTAPYDEALDVLAAEWQARDVEAGGELAREVAEAFETWS